MQIDSEVKSPCIDICQLNAERICIGCWRHVDEIAAWRQLDNVVRNAVIARAQQRREECLVNEKN